MVSAAEVLSTVLPDVYKRQAQTVAADGAGAGDADDLAVHGQALQNIGADLGQVGVGLSLIHI